ncbi:hypothetical protein Vadar_033591 [Vaccinium darrowii]|uniref:Uncharacterized protein n=1 Tax=Vaccinium darrowii TaxID=229202 RepID=A0ACB7X6K8_9ERIC|nr:hypothetical protein Vadar_033591 [Vaccinium darrowii]
MNTTCSSCGALHWMDEKLANSSKRNPCFRTCCLQGKVKLPPLMTPPAPIQALYDGNDDRSKSFRGNTRSYNAANAFTSLGAKFDDRVFGGRGPTSFTIHGELRHRTGSLMPLPGEDPSYAQLYIYDPNSALDVRGRRNPHLRRDVLEIIQESLLQVNEFVGKFRQAHAILNQLALSGQNLPAHLHYTASTDRRRYNLPTSDEIVVIIPGDGTEASGMRDIVLHLCGNNELMRINECHPAYLPLHYVLLFPHGELGWDPDLQQWDVDIDNHPLIGSPRSSIIAIVSLSVSSIVAKGSREQIVNASLRWSTLWKDIVISTLDENMRLDRADSRNANFAKFLTEIGTSPEEAVNLPSTIRKCRDLNELLSTVYPQLDVIDASTPAFLTERTILSARNDDVNAINAAALNIFPGEAFTYLAADKMSEDDGDWDEKVMELKRKNTFIKVVKNKFEGGNK